MTSVLCQTEVGGKHSWLAKVNEQVYRCAGRGNLGFSIGSDRLTQAGQRAAALRQYEECVRILEAELGLPPSQETASLHEQIRAGAAGRAEPPVAQPRHNLPAQPTPFIGREAVLAEIRAHLESPNCRLLTLVGPGGSGKTRLALEAAAAQAVTGASLRELMWLVDRSLLHRMPTGRYEVHELLRQYGEERLDESPGAGEAAQDRHSAYWAGALERWARDLKSPRQQAALAEMEVESENARAT